MNKLNEKQHKIMEYIKKYRWFLPFGIYLILQLLAVGVGKLTNLTLRSIPKLFLFWMAVITSMLLILGISRKILKWGCEKGVKAFPVIKNIWYVILGIVASGVIYIGFAVSAFMYQPEHIVVRNGVRMVASVNSFLQETVYYYEYKNIFFRGSEMIGYEDYGNGSRDPLKDGNREPIQQFFDE